MTLYRFFINPIRISAVFFTILLNCYALFGLAQEDNDQISMVKYFDGTLSREDYALLVTSIDATKKAKINNELLDFTELSNSLKDRFGFQTDRLLQISTEILRNKLALLASQEFNKQDQLLLYFSGFNWNFELDSKDATTDYSFKSTAQKGAVLSIHELLLKIDSLPIEHILVIFDLNEGHIKSDLNTVFRDVRKGESCGFNNRLGLRTRKLIVVGNCANISGVAPFLDEFKNFTKTINELDKVLCLAELDDWLIENKKFCSYFAAFGSDEPGSEFVLIQH